MMSSMRWSMVLVMFVVMAFGVGCSSSDESSLEPGQISLESSHDDIDATPGWLNVKTLLIYPSQETPEPEDMFVRGTLRGWVFTPDGDIEGNLQEPDVPGRTEPAWLVLADRSLILVDGGRLPERPFVSGRFDPEDRLFYPDQRMVRDGVPAPKAMAVIDVGDVEKAEEDIDENEVDRDAREGSTDVESRPTTSS